MFSYGSLLILFLIVRNAKIGRPDFDHNDVGWEAPSLRDVEAPAGLGPCLEPGWPARGVTGRPGDCPAGLEPGWLTARPGGLAAAWRTGQEGRTRRQERRFWISAPRGSKRLRTLRSSVPKHCYTQPQRRILFIFLGVFVCVFPVVFYKF